MIPMRGAGRDQQMQEEEYDAISKAEANIRADYAASRITRLQFQKEMHIVSMARSHAALATTPKES